MALSELSVKQAKPQNKEYMLHDDRGLYLLVKPGGGKYWRLRYWKKGKDMVDPFVKTKNSLSLRVVVL